MKPILPTLALCLAAASAAGAWMPFPRFDSGTYQLWPNSLLSSNLVSQFFTNFNGQIYPRTETRDLILRDLFFFDDFNRTNTEPGGIQTSNLSPSGHEYRIEGPNLGQISTNSLHISNGVARISDNVGPPYQVYMRVEFPVAPTAVGARLAFYPGDPASSYPQGLTIAVSSSDNGYTKMIHLNNNAFGSTATLTTNFGAVGLNQYLCTIDPPDLNPTNTFTEVGMEYLGENVVRVWGYGTNILVRHPWIDEVWGTNVYYQIGGSTNWTKFKTGADAIWAGVARSAGPFFSDEFAYTNTVGSGFNTNTLRLALTTNAIMGNAEDASPDGANDYLLTYDASAGQKKRVLLNNLPTGGGGEINTGANDGGAVGVYAGKSGTVLHFNSFNADQFTSNNSVISIVDSAPLTNPIVWETLTLPARDATPASAGEFLIDTNETGGSVLKYIGGDGFIYYVVATTNTPSDNQIPTFDAGIGRYGAESGGGGGGDNITVNGGAAVDPNFTNAVDLLSADAIGIDWILSGGGDRIAGEFKFNNADFQISGPSNTLALGASALKTNTTLRRYLYAPAGAFLNVSNAASGIYSNGLAARDVWDMDDTAPMHVGFNSTLGDGWDKGTLKAKFHWLCATTNASTTNVVWMIRASAGTNDVLGTHLGSWIYVTNAGPTIANQLIVSGASGPITVGGTPANGYPIDFEMARDAGNSSDDQTGDARLLAVEIQYGVVEGSHGAW